MGKYSAIVNVLVGRLKHHTDKRHPDRILWSAHFEDIPKTGIQGEQDVTPAKITMQVPTIREDYRTRGQAIGSSQIQFIVHTPKSKGNAYHTEWLEKLMDALETDTDTNGTIDGHLDGTIHKAMGIVASSSDYLDLSIQTSITVTVEPRIYLRGTRRT